MNYVNHYEAILVEEHIQSMNQDYGMPLDDLYKILKEIREETPSLVIINIRRAAAHYVSNGQLDYAMWALSESARLIADNVYKQCSTIG